ncbi:class II aldolase/adducin family protein [Rhodopila sp.]|uniref:class II aldolase/adducin family protein n=1 Tax=Rhodopila sp. TaxID=2480087 RepID=UPI003D0DA46A
MDAETAALSDTDTQARLDLAAVYRLLALHGWGDVIFNHAAMRCPSNPRHFLIKRHELQYAEVTASNLVEVSMDDDLDERSGVNRPGFTLHSGVLRARPDVHCSVHVHPEEAIALSGLAHGLRPLSQNAMRFYNRMGYHDYEGLTDSFDERDRIAAALGRNRALLMRHHGITTVGATAREAFSLMKEFVRAARIQLQMEATGAKLLEIPAHVCERVAAQYEQHDRGRASAEWPAYLRQLDGIDPSYRT